MLAISFIQKYEQKHTCAYTEDAHIGHKAQANCNLSRPVCFSASCRQEKWDRGLSVRSFAWGDIWAVNKLLFQSFAVNISYSTGGDWRMKNSKRHCHHPYQPTQSAPHVTGSPEIGSPHGACNKHSEHVLSCWWGSHSHSDTHTHAHSLLYAHTITPASGQTGPITSCKYPTFSIESGQNWQIKTYLSLKPNKKIHRDAENGVYFPRLNEYVAQGSSACRILKE